MTGRAAGAALNSSIIITIIVILVIMTMILIILKITLIIMMITRRIVMIARSAGGGLERLYGRVLAGLLGRGIPSLASLA